MPQLLRAVVAQEDPDMIPSTSTWQLTANSSFGLFDALFWHPQALHKVPRHTYRQNTNTHIFKDTAKINERRRKGKKGKKGTDKHF